MVNIDIEHSWSELSYEYMQIYKLPLGEGDYGLLECGKNIVEYVKKGQN